MQGEDKIIINVIRNMRRYVENKQYSLVVRNIHRTKRSLGN